MKQKNYEEKTYETKNWKFWSDQTATRQGVRLDLCKAIFLGKVEYQLIVDTLENNANQISVWTKAEMDALSKLRKKRIVGPLIAIEKIKNGETVLGVETKII